MTDAKNKALYIAEQCLKAGLTLAGAAGVIANVEAESAFNPHNLQDSYERVLGYNDETYTAAVDNGTYFNFTGDAAGYGISQWTASDRKAKMRAYFTNRRISIGDFQTQVDFLLCEMRGYSKAWNVCTSSNSPADCGYAVCKYYEIPADTEAQAQYRACRAQGWYSFLAATMQQGAESEIPEEDAQPPELDDDGIIPKTWPPRTIDSHCEGFPEIGLLQNLLRCHGYNVLTDGISSQSLWDKFEAFQSAQGLRPDRICGPMSWAALGLDPAIFKQ